MTFFNQTGGLDYDRELSWSNGLSRYNPANYSRLRLKNIERFWRDPSSPILIWNYVIHRLLTDTNSIYPLLTSPDGATTTLDGIHFHCPIIINYHPQLNATPHLCRCVCVWVASECIIVGHNHTTSLFIQTIDPSTSEPVVIVIEPVPSSFMLQPKGLMVDQRRTSPAQ